MKSALSALAWSGHAGLQDDLHARRAQRAYGLVHVGGDRVRELLGKRNVRHAFAAEGQEIPPKIVGTPGTHVHIVAQTD